MTGGRGGDRPPDTPGPDPALDVRDELTRSVADLPVAELLPAVHLRARRIRRRRRVATGVAITLSALTVAAAGAILPALTSHRTAAGWPSAEAPSPAPTGGVAAPWGAPTIDDDFAAGLERSLWTVYDGPGDPLGRWSPAETTVRDGALRLSVSRPGGDPASRWGGIGATGSGQRYGRWEARLRMTTGRGVIGQLVLSPAADAADAAARCCDIVVSIVPYQRAISVSGSGTGAGGTRTAALDRPGDHHWVAVEWTPRRVRVLLDGAGLFEWTDARLPAPLWPALQTIMAGPDCGAAPLPADCQGTTTSFPQRMDVDRIRVRPYLD
jgi:hypothetical protein